MSIKTTKYRRLKRSIELGIPEKLLPDLRGKHKNHSRGSNHHRWNHDRIINKDGYVMIRVGKTHPMADKNGYCLEHDLIMACAIGGALEDGYVVHHINNDKIDNRIENLKLLSISKHNKIHNANKKRDSKGRFVAKHK